MNSMHFHLGKTIDKIIQGKSYLTIYFTDETEVTIRACGTKEQWIEID